MFQERAEATLRLSERLAYPLFGLVLEGKRRGLANLLVIPTPVRLPRLPVRGGLTWTLVVYNLNPNVRVSLRVEAAQSGKRKHQ